MYGKKIKLAMGSIIALTAIGITLGGIALGKAQASSSMAEVTTVSIHSSANAAELSHGTSTLVRARDGISASFETEGLQPGNAYTLWWVIFNHPEKCEHPVPGVTSCGEVDSLAQPLGDTPVLVSVQYAAGNVASGAGTADFGAYLSEGEVPVLPGQLVFGSGLTDAKKAEVHLVVRDHGPALPGMIEPQVTTFGGGCTPETEPTGVGPFGPNACTDVQFAAHVPSKIR